uniref:Acyltransferase n=1 Tax=candidate division CPR3 bacterium TaxID=2268181 RepID=A0A7C4R4I8_UNCC3
MKDNSDSHYYIPGLDGLRAIAVIAVVIYHLGFSYLPGGFLGVDVFFVISGFLITSLILLEIEKSGRIDFKKFYLRRARRLLPALFAVLFFCGLASVYFAPDTISSFRRDFFPSLFYFSNWGYIFTKQSYFEFIGHPPLLQHLWSLAIEEQFYLLWPGFALILWKIRKKTAIWIVAVCGVVFSTLLMLHLSLVMKAPIPNDPSRIYFGTDTHSMGLFVGIVLAVFFQPWKKRKKISSKTGFFVWLLGISALAFLFFSFLKIGEYSSFLYRGGFLVVAIFSVIAVFASSFQGVGFGKLISLWPMRYIGSRSYGIYLWHWPIFLVTRPGIDIKQTGTSAILIQLILLFIFSELSYRFVEMPIRNGAIDRIFAWFRKNEYYLQSTPALCFIFIFTISSAFLTLKVITSPIPKESDMIEEFGLVETDGSGLRFGGEEEAPKTQDLFCAPEGNLYLATRVDFNYQEKDCTKNKIVASAIGDSVILGASPSMGRGEFDLMTYAVVSESPQNSVNRALELNRSGKLADVVIVHTGNNGPITEKMLVSLLEGLRDRKRVVIVNNKERRSWEEPNNQLYAKIVPNYPNARLMDWREYFIDHPEYFHRDGIHVNITGAKKYAELAAILAQYPDEKDFRIKIVKYLNPFSRKKRVAEKAILSSISSFEK